MVMGSASNRLAAYTAAAATPATTMPVRMFSVLFELVTGGGSGLSFTITVVGELLILLVSSIVLLGAWRIVELLCVCMWARMGEESAPSP